MIYLCKEAELVLAQQQELEDALRLEGHPTGKTFYLKLRRNRVKSLAKGLEMLYRGWLR